MHFLFTEEVVRTFAYEQLFGYVGKGYKFLTSCFISADFFLCCKPVLYCHFLIEAPYLLFVGKKPMSTSGIVQRSL